VKWSAWFVWAPLPISFLLTGTGAIGFSGTLRGQGLTADAALQDERCCFNRVSCVSFMVDPSLAGWAGLHAAIVDNKAMPAPARDDPVFRHFLSAPGATPGIDGGRGGRRAGRRTQRPGPARSASLCCRE